MSSWHRSHRGQCIGRVLHFLYHYCGFSIAEHAQIGYKEVYYQDRLIATYEYLSDTDIPFFTFKTPTAPYWRDPERMKAEWERNQQTKWHEAVKEAEDTPEKPCEKCRSLKLRLQIFDVPKHIWEDK